MRTKLLLVIGTLILSGWCFPLGAIQQPDIPSTPLTETGQKLEASYAAQLNQLRRELTAKLPSYDSVTGDELDRILASNVLDARLAKYVVLSTATPLGLAKFAQQGKAQENLVNSMLMDADLMQRMLVADGAAAIQMGRTYGPSQYGPAMAIYGKIRQVCEGTQSEILQRLALAVSLEHAVPIAQANPTALSDAPETVDPVSRYLHYEKAFLAGELDPAFEQLSAWELRMVVNGDEPDETLTWGREMLRNYRPDHIYNANFGWRYVSIVGSDVKYGSENVKYDRPELQRYQNILLNGGVCGRRAFFGRFILRAFGVPTIARPSRGHGALAHWTPDGWVVNLGGGWGCGWTKTRYYKDVDFLATAQARNDSDAYMKVKRAQWIGDVFGEKRTYGSDDEHEFWNGLAQKTQRVIIEEAKAVTLDALGEDLGEANEPTVAQKVLASPVTPEDRKIAYSNDGSITLPAAAFTLPKGNTKDVIAMKSFGGGLQIFLPRFFPQGTTIMRGGTWKGDANACTSGKRMLSGGYGRYENWGLRAAVSSASNLPTQELTLDLGNGVTMELVYIQPGAFVMGGESKTDGRFECVEIPKHDVELSKGFYLGKYEVTQEQYEAIMGSNPSKSTKAPNCPVDNVGEPDAKTFCGKLAEKTGLDVRLPTEAEWEYASRGGSDTKWFFGNDPVRLGEFAWFKSNAGGMSHPVGQKKPNPWGLYDIYGNVNERISDKYARNYYAESPAVDPTGPSQGTKSRFEYHVNVPRSGKYNLSALVVTSNLHQRLNVAANNGNTETVMEMPFTLGRWEKSPAITISLNEGENTLRFWRNQPPQFGLAIKEFTLTPIK